MFIKTWIMNLVGSTVFTTVVTGVFVFTLGQITLKFLLEPLYEYKKIKSKISYALVYYADLYSNPVFIDSNPNQDLTKRINEGQVNIRNIAAEICAWGQIMPLYKLFSLIRLIPSRVKIEEVSGSLIGISNGLYYSESLDQFSQIHFNKKRKQKIAKILRLYLV